MKRYICILIDKKGFERAITLFHFTRRISFAANTGSPQVHLTPDDIIFSSGLESIEFEVCRNPVKADGNTYLVYYHEV